MKKPFAPPTVTDAPLLEAYEAGRQAHADGKTISDLPLDWENAGASAAARLGWCDEAEGVPRERSATLRDLLRG